MTTPDLQAILPLTILGGAAVLVMLAVAIRRHHGLTFALTLVGLAAALVSIWFTGVVGSGGAARHVTPLLVVDSLAMFFVGIIIAATGAVALLAYGYLRLQAGQKEEFYILLLLACLGSSVLASAAHFASLILGLEVLSVSLYALAAYSRDKLRCIEAGIKYLVLAATSAAFLIFGAALVYAQTGSLEFSRLSAPGAPGLAADPILLAGLAMVVVGIAFKLALAPFHLWTPDVYQGAPAPVTAFIASVSKGAVFAVLLRLFAGLLAAPAGQQAWAVLDWSAHPESLWLYRGFALLAMASMFTGNLLALRQQNVKRLLAYSSIAHLGYALVAFLAGGAAGLDAAAFYMLAYFITTLAAFGVVTVLSTGQRDAEAFDDYRGLAWRRPLTAALFTAALMSLAGIPLTAGFIGKFYLVSAGANTDRWALLGILVINSGIGKFYLVAAGADADRWALLGILVINSGIGLYYYLRLVATMYASPVPVPPPGLARRPLAISAGIPIAGGIALVVLAVLLIVLGISPPMLELGILP